MPALVRRLAAPREEIHHGVMVRAVIASAGLARSSRRLESDAGGPADDHPTIIHSSCFAGAGTATLER